MNMYKHSIEILCILNKILNGNIDIIQMIYNYKKIIEENELFFYYLMNGFKYDLLILPKDIRIFKNLINKVSIEESNIIQEYENIQSEFLSLITVSKISRRWVYQKEEDLINDPRYYMKIIMGAFDLDNFIKVRNIHEVYIMECPNSNINLFRKPTIKEKARTINTILEKKGIFY